MAEGDRINDDAADAGTAGDGGIDDGGEGRLTSGAEAAGSDPAGFEPSGVADPRQQGDEGGESSRAGDWNPGARSGGGGELY
jgi:hypothetical protein